MPLPTPRSDESGYFCEVCGASLGFLPSSKRRRNRTCSSECAKILRKREIREGKKVSPPKRPIKERKRCLDCGKGLYLSNTSGCCKTCFNKRKYIGGNFCEFCGASVNYESRFCNKCKGIVKRKEKKIYICPQCDKKFEKLESTVQVDKPFCSRKCARIYRGREKGIGKTDFRRLLRSSNRWITLNWKILQRDNYTCVRCGSMKDLIVHHIKPVGVLIEDFVNVCKVDLRSCSSLYLWECAEKYTPFWDEENLMTLCRNCHSNIHPNVNLVKNYRRSNKYALGKR